MSLYYSILNRCGKHRLREIGKARSLLVAPKPSPCHSEPASAVRNLLLRVSPRLSGASKMKSAFESLAPCSCGLFAAAALYINLVEHPARMSCDVAVALTDLRRRYKRPTVIQSCLAAVSFG